MMGAGLIERIRDADLIGRTGKVTRILPTFVEANGPALPLGALCTIETRNGGPSGASILAEVVGVHPTSVILAPFTAGAQTFSGAQVKACADADSVPVGDGFLGRAVDALGRPIDGGAPVFAQARRSLAGGETTPMDRISPKEILETGVRAIDGLLTLGRGQRVGVFAAAGVGKTSLLGQLARQVEVDRCVICLVGERGREVEALWNQTLSPEAKRKTVLVAATSDQAAAMRVRASDYALALAEHWRERGHHVLLLVDSVTRLAMAMRELGLAAGEPPTVRAYTPGVFAAIPRLVERCGALQSGGAISAIMTVLAETDDVDDPISEVLKSLVDGHIVLSRELAEQGHFPAIDVPRSVSRLAQSLADKNHHAAATAATALLSTYQSSKTLIESGVYVRGASVEIDRSLDRRPKLQAFLKQRLDERSQLLATIEGLSLAVGRGA